MDKGNATKQPSLTVIVEDKLGGVTTFASTFLQDLADIDISVTVIYLRSTDDSCARAPGKFGVGKEISVKLVPSKGPWRNSLAIHRAIPPGVGYILANSRAELEALRFYPHLEKRVVFFCHDYLYIDWAFDYRDQVDYFFAHNPHVVRELKQTLPGRSADVFSFRFGIRLPDGHFREHNHQPLRVAFLGRLHENKGIHELKQIDQLLVSASIQVEWTVVGDGPEKKAFLESVKDRSNFSLSSPKTREAVYSTIKDCDLLLLPSRIDGTPVAVMEAMGLGLVPILYEFCSGVHAMFPEDTGYVVPLGDRTAVVQRILELSSDRNLLNRRRKASYEYARSNFNSKHCSNKLLDHLVSLQASSIRTPSPRPVYSRLDNPAFPFIFVRFCRMLIHYVRQLCKR